MLSQTTGPWAAAPRRTLFQCPHTTAPLRRSPTPAPPCGHPTTNPYQSGMSTKTCWPGAGTFGFHVCHLGVTISNIRILEGSKKQKAKTGYNSSGPPTGRADTHSLRDRKAPCAPGPYFPFPQTTSRSWWRMGCGPELGRCGGQRVASSHRLGETQGFTRTLRGLPTSGPCSQHTVPPCALTHHTAGSRVFSSANRFPFLI